MSISELLANTSETPNYGEFFAQISTVKERETKNGKPFLEWSLADSTGGLTFKVWNNHPQWEAAHSLTPSSLIQLAGTWTQNQFGLDAKEWKFRKLNEDEQATFFAGDPALREKQDADWQDLLSFLDDLADPRLKALCQLFIDHHGDRFRRTAAAKKNHHARRGGIVEHVAQMMRSANAITTVYPYLNHDLLIAAILFHDCGKLWENTYPEKGFQQLHLLHGEMLGHIPLGLELVNKLWRDLPLDSWLDLDPPSDDVRLHLLHLIASHHGQHDFGSPTLPRTPEAFALHYIDNLDAKLEMVKDAYANANELAPGIFERQFPIPTNLVAPLPPYPRPDATPAPETPPAPSDQLF